MTPRKYGNTKVEHDGQTFDSKRELRRWKELCLLERAGEISGLQRQQAFVIVDSVTLDGRKAPARKYIADFTYRIGDRLVVEDAKGFKTDMYRLKRHLMKLVHGIEVQEI